MNTQPISTYIVRGNPNSGGVVTAESVAVTYNSDSGVMSETLAQRLTSIANELKYSDTESIKTHLASLQTIISETNKLDAGLIKYTPSGESETTVSAYLAELLSKINNQIETLDAAKVIYTAASGDNAAVTIKDKVNEIINSLEVLSATSVSYTPTGKSKTTVGAYLDSIETNIQQVNTKATLITEVYNNISNVSGKIANLETIAQDLSNSLDSSAQFIICSTPTYNSIDPAVNTIYFCYNQDDTTNIVKLTTSVNNTEYGQVLGDGSYTKGTSVKVIAIPKSGYNFKKWSDESISNPYSITLNEDTTITAIFEALS